MATSGSVSEAFTGRSRFRLRAAIALDTADGANNRSKWDYSLRVDNVDRSSATWTTERPSFDLRIAGQNFDGAQVPAGTFDFRDGDSYHNIVLGTTDWISHNADGGVGIAISAAIAGVFVFGSSSPSGTVRAYAPAKPNPIGVDQIMPTSARFRFSSAGVGDGLTGWQAQIATNAAFTQDVVTLPSSGTTTFENLNPATVYYFRARGLGVVGYGAWSNAVAAMTASGAYVSQDGAWVGVPVAVSDGTDWLAPDLLISDGTTWKAAE